jgi:hypothetical protein
MVHAMAADNNASKAAQEMMLEVPTIRHELQSDNGVLEDLLESYSYTGKFSTFMSVAT